MEFKTHTIDWDNGTKKYEWFHEVCQKFFYDDDKEKMHEWAKRHHKGCEEKMRKLKEESPEGFEILSRIKGWG